jgi:hypothetical protein
MDELIYALDEYGIEFDLAEWVGHSGELHESITLNNGNYRWVVDIADEGDYLATGYAPAEPERFGDPVGDFICVREFEADAIIEAMGFDLAVQREEVQEQQRLSDTIYREMGTSWNQ